MSHGDPASTAPILLVDDDQVVLDVTAEILRSDGFEVVAVERAADALQLLEGGLAPVLLVTDHVMPDMTGAELLHQVVVAWPHLPVLMITGFIERVTALPANVPILRKPFRLQDLVSQVRSLVQAG